MRGELDPDRGFFCNVLDLKGVVDELVADPCEHHFLNDLPLFEGVVPTTMENLSRVCGRSLSQRLRTRVWNYTNYCWPKPRQHRTPAQGLSPMVMRIEVDFPKPIQGEHKTGFLLALAVLPKTARVRFVDGGRRALVMGEALGLDRVRSALEDEGVPIRPAHLLARGRRLTRR